MLVVEEVRRVARVQLHGGEAFVRREGRAGPFPEAADVRLAAKLVVVGDRGWVEVAERDVLSGQWDEEVIWIELGLCVWCAAI